MEEMGDDEVLALIASVIAGVLGAAAWYGRGLRITWLGAARGPRNLLLLTPVLALAGLWRVLSVDAAVDVRTDVRYQFLFVAMGTIWVFHLPRSLSFIGVSYTSDALERRNVAASVALIGAVAGLGMLFAGSNMGEGPSIWNTVATAVVATGILFTALLLLAGATRIGDSISIERDVASGLRLGAFLVGAGAVLARAAAGDWVSLSATVRDLLTLGWPVAVLLIAAIAVEPMLRPRLAIPRPSILAAGVVPASVYLLGSFAYVASVSGAAD